MDRHKKLFFVLLAVIGVLCFASLGTGIWANQMSGDDQPRSLSAATDQWVGALGPALSAFAPAFNFSGLHCNGQRVDKIFKLELSGRGERQCAIGIPPAPDHDYRRAELRTLGSDIGIYVHAVFERDRFDPKDRADNCVLDDHRLPDGLRLEVRYEPNDSGSSGNDDTWECWLVEEPAKPVAIVALKDGGTLRLTLRCDDCQEHPGCVKPCDDTTHLLRLRMR